MKIGRFRVSSSYLLQGLGIRKHTIVGISLNEILGSVEIRITGPDMPEVEEGEVIPGLGVMIKREQPSQGHHFGKITAEFKQSE